MKTKLFENFFSEKKKYLSQCGDFVSGKRHQTNQYHSWLGHEDEGQESKSNPKENMNLSSLMADYQKVAKRFKPILFTKVNLTMGQFSPLFPNVNHFTTSVQSQRFFSSLCFTPMSVTVERRWDLGTSNISPIKRSDGIN